MRKLYFFKIISILTLLFIKIPPVYANDVWVGTSSINGRECYVVTESIKWRGDVGFDVIVKAVDDDDILRIKYQFTINDDGNVRFNSSEGYSNYIKNCPLENAIFLYVRDNHNPFKC